jgi:hypothetical protein
MGVSTLPLWLLLLCVVAAAILIALGCIWLANRILPASLGREHNPTMAPFITVVGIVNGVLLGFTVVAAWQQFSSAEVIVGNEASTLTTMYRQTVAMPESEQTQMKQLLRKYTNAVARTEWGKQGSGGTSDSARAAITDMYRAIGSQPPDVASRPITGEFLSQLTVLASHRTMRIIDTKPRIPALLWSGLILGGIVLIALTGFLRLGSALGHAIVSSTIAVLLGLMLFIAFSLDHPYGNERGITSAPFQHAMEVFDAVDRGT